MLLRHGRELIGFLPLEDLYGEFADHHRLQVFAEKGLDCVACEREGKLLIISRETHGYKQSRKRGSVGRVHIDLYTDDFVLMTVDHITPKYVCKMNGWTKAEMEDLSNKQPMCDPCNNSKGHKVLTVEEMQLNRRRTNQLKTGTEIVRNIVPNIHALLGDKV